MANQGHETYLVEKDSDLGGMARRIHYTLEGLDVQAYLGDLKKKVYRHPLIHVYHGRHHHGRLRLRGKFRHQGEVQGQDPRDQAWRGDHRDRRRRVQAQPNTSTETMPGS